MSVNPTVDWPELLGLGFLIAGFFLAIFSPSPLVLYTVCFLMGLIFGRIWYKYRTSECIPLFIIVMAFFLGFVLGGIWANLRVIALTLMAGTLAGYWLHAKKIIRTF